MQEYLFPKSFDLGNTYSHINCAQHISFCYSQRSHSSNRNKENKQQKTRRSRELYELRKNQIECEKQRISAINKFTETIKENNEIQRERNRLLETLINIQSNKT